MNERIQELAEQAGCSIDRLGYGEGNLEKFAELIVRECISLFDGTKEMQTVGVLTHGQVIKQIKQHFGVE